MTASVKKEEIWTQAQKEKPCEHEDSRLAAEERGLERILPHSPQEGGALLTPSRQNCEEIEEIGLCCPSHPVGGTVRQP